MAARTLKRAFTTDVTPILARARLERGAAVDPIGAYRASAYRNQCAKLRPISDGSRSASSERRTLDGSTLKASTPVSVDLYSVQQLTRSPRKRPPSSWLRHPITIRQHSGNYCGPRLLSCRNREGCRMRPFDVLLRVTTKRSSARETPTKHSLRSSSNPLPVSERQSGWCPSSSPTRYTIFHCRPLVR
jgi:hypothetical protein